jgi:hypothetical protein
MTKIIYPTLDLFLYQLRNSLGDGEKEIKENHSRFWQNIPGIKLDLEKESDALNLEYIKLLDLLEASVKRNLNIQDNNYLYEKQEDNYSLEGYYYPVSLAGSYGLIFDTSINDKQNAQPVNIFKTFLKQAKDKKGNIGKSWMASGYLPIINTNTNELAKEIYKEIYNKQWQKVETGKFLGADLFETWEAPQKWQDIETENKHLLIIIYPNLQIMDNYAGSFYGDWLRLFCYRNQIIWEYAYGQKLVRELREKFQLINQKPKKIQDLYLTDKEKPLNSKQLQELQNILINSINALSEYVTKLSYLEILKSAIDINLQAYNKQLKEIETKAKQKQQQDSNVGDTDLKCLKKFASTVKDKYKTQIQIDHTALSLGTKIAEETINTIRGIIEIEQTKRERDLQIYIGAIGAGIGVSGVVGSAFQYVIPTSPTIAIQLPFTSLKPHPIFYILLWSLGSGLAIAIIVILFQRFVRRRY